MATRTIENRKDRLATIFVAPFMSCSARLPVYTLLIGTFFAGYGALRQAGIMLSLYALGIAAAAGTAWLFKRSMLKGPKSSFILEMPTYKVPQASQVARQVWINTWAFLSKAGTTIFCLSVLLWALAYYPRLPAQDRERIAHDRRAELETGPTLKGQIRYDDLSSGTMPIPKNDVNLHRIVVDDDVANTVKAAELSHSFAGRFGHAIEPAIKPLGYDWKMGVGLVGAFAAREVFVSTMGIVYSVGGDDEDTTPLAEQMKNDRYPNGKPVWTPLVAVSLLVWFVLAMQCMSTLAIVRRETGGWKWPIAMLVYMNALAYVVALLVYQVGTRLA
jgi:ferrous iron transport protein B